MPNQKISQDPNAVELVGDELIPMVQGGVNVKATPEQVADFVAAGIDLSVKADKSYVDSENDAQDLVIAGKISEVSDDASPELSADLDAGNHKIVNLTDPTSNQDAATKAYVDANAGGDTGDVTFTDNIVSTVDEDQDLILSPNGDGNVQVQKNILLKKENASIIFQESNDGDTATIQFLESNDAFKETSINIQATRSIGISTGAGSLNITGKATISEAPVGNDDITNKNYVDGELSLVMDEVLLKQNASAKLDSVSSLDYDSNAGKVIAVNNTEDGFELVEVSGGGDTGDVTFTDNIVSTVDEDQDLILSPNGDGRIVIDKNLHIDATGSRQSSWTFQDGDLGDQITFSFAQSNDSFRETLFSIQATRQIHLNGGVSGVLMSKATLEEMGTGDDAVPTKQYVDGEVSLKQDASAKLDSVSALDYDSNAGKAIVVNDTEDGFELVEVSGGGGGISSVEDDTTPTLGGELDADNKKIVNLGTPTNSNDAATKAYVDANAGGGSAGALEFLGTFEVEYSDEQSFVNALDVFTDSHSTYLVLGEGFNWDEDGGTILYMRFQKDGQPDLDDDEVYDQCTIQGSQSSQGVSIDYMDHSNQPQSAYIPAAPAQLFDVDQDSGRVSRVPGEATQQDSNFEMWVFNARANTYTTARADGVLNDDGNAQWDCATTHKVAGKVAGFGLYISQNTTDYIRGKLHIYGVKVS